jgi:hypothetical protein
VHKESPDDFIKSINNLENKKLLMNQLLRLGSVCKYINLSDLHGDNIIFQVREDDSSVQIVAIDLENIQADRPTYLYRKDPTFPKFNEVEIEKLKDFNVKGDFPRFVPIETGTFLGGLIACDSFKVIAQLIIFAMEQEGWEMLIQETGLGSLILTDFLHDDVPFLTHNGQEVYYWTSSESVLIAKK